MEEIFRINDPEIDAGAIMSAIRKSIEEKRKKGIYSERKLEEAEKLKIGDSPSRADFMRHCIGTAGALSQVDIDNYRFGIPPVLNRPVLGHMVLAFKSVIRRFLRFHTRGVFHQQIEFNRQVVELLSWLNDRTEELEDELVKMKMERGK